MSSLVNQFIAECESKMQELDKNTFGQYQITNLKGIKKTGAANITVSISDDVS